MSTGETYRELSYVTDVFDRNVETWEFDPNATGKSGRNCFHQVISSGNYKHRIDAIIETLEYLNSKYPSLKNNKDNDENSSTDTEESSVQESYVEWIKRATAIAEAEGRKVGITNWVTAQRRRNVIQDLAF